jgi:hypothetical protein
MCLILWLLSARLATAMVTSAPPLGQRQADKILPDHLSLRGRCRARQLTARLTWRARAPLATCVGVVDRPVVLTGRTRLDRPPCPLSAHLYKVG